MVVFVLWIVFIFSRAKNKLEFNKKVYKNKDFCDIGNQKSDKTLSIIYADLEPLIEKINRCIANF